MTTVIIVLSALTTLLVLLAIGKWFWNRLAHRQPHQHQNQQPPPPGAGNQAGGNNPPPTVNTAPTPTHSNTLDWITLAKAVILVAIAIVLIWFVVGLFSPVMEWFAKLMASSTPTMPVFDWYNWDYSEPKSWFAAGFSLLMVYLVYKIIQSAIFAFGRNTPVAGTPGNPIPWTEIGKGLVYLSIAVGLGFLLYNFREAPALLVKKIENSSWSTNQDHEENSSGSTSRTKNLDEKLLALDPYVLDEEIEIARVRFQHTYDIPTSEVDQQLRIAGNIPGTQFRSNMIQRYGFKDLPLMMRDLPSSVVKVPEKVKVDGKLIHNSYNLYLKVRKGTLSRPIRIDGWDDRELYPADMSLLNDYKIVCDPGRSNQQTFVYRRDPAGGQRYWQELSNGKWKKLPSNWRPQPTHSYALVLLDDYPKDQVDFRIVRFRDARVK